MMHSGAFCLSGKIVEKTSNLITFLQTFAGTRDWWREAKDNWDDGCLRVLLSNSRGAPPGSSEPFFFLLFLFLLSYAAFHNKKGRRVSKSVLATCSWSLFLFCLAPFGSERSTVSEEA
jgi:hypothetical protein